MSGADVAETQNALQQLGFKIPAANQRASKYGKGTHNAVAQFQAARGLQPTGTIDAVTAAALSAAVAEATYVVTGTVSSPTSASVGGLDVQIVDKNVGGDAQLIATKTDARGAYAATAVIPLGVLLKRLKTRPDLQARVSSSTTFLAASDVAYNAPPSATLDVALPADATLPSEYETLTATLAAAYAGPLGALQENAQRQDITYLANKTGWDARAVALAALAAQFSQPVPTQARRSRGAAAAAAPAINPEFYYALFRAGLPANSETLYLASPKTVAAIWNQAITQAVIPSSLAAQIPTALTAYQTLSAMATLSAKPTIGISPIKDMLQLSVSDTRQQQQFAQLYAQYSDDTASLWAAVQRNLSTEVAKKLQLDGQLGYMTFNNAPVMSALHSAERSSPLTSTLDLATRGYYDAAKWQPLVGTSIPSQIPGATADEQRAHYAELLAAQVRIAFPTMVIADLVRQSKLPMQGDATVATGVADFLTSN
jgi:peptidoglycan hydrolase-like protein with peptidoglycan-binding domain